MREKENSPAPIGIRTWDLSIRSLPLELPPQPMYTQEHPRASKEFRFHPTGDTSSVSASDEGVGQDGLLPAARRVEGRMFPYLLHKLIYSLLKL